VSRVLAYDEAASRRVEAIHLFLAAKPAGSRQQSDKEQACCTW
jgi:hypothetical protein